MAQQFFAPSFRPPRVHALRDLLAEIAERVQVGSAAPSGPPATHAPLDPELHLDPPFGRLGVKPSGGRHDR